MDDANPGALHPTDRSTLRRRRERGSYEREVIHAILDEAMICHVGTSDGQSVYVVPMAYATIGERLYVHGAAANHLLRTLSGGGESCITVTILDGLVLARSSFHHSMNYRSVMLFGRGEEVADPEEKRSALNAIVDHLAPGRTKDARPPTDIELRATTVVRFPIDEGSAKVRTGPPIDDPEDLELPIWAGVLPITSIGGAPIVDESGVSGIVTPQYATDHHRGRGRG
jgi:nitroimidazol reductase NimA-like FMN-containing flavoprotein (pyridoxamine 5'-phosphate oxidase superfamily)